MFARRSDGVEVIPRVPVCHAGGRSLPGQAGLAGSPWGTGGYAPPGVTAPDVPTGGPLDRASVAGHSPLAAAVGDGPPGGLPGAAQQGCGCPTSSGAVPRTGSTRLVSGAPEPSQGRGTQAPGVEAERALLGRARQGDTAAFEHLLAPVMHPAYQLAVRLLGDRQLAEDVTQDAFTKAYLGLGHFRGDARFGTWIFRIVHNACTDALRYRARRPHLPAPPGGIANGDGVASQDPADTAPGPEDVVLERSGRQAILDAVGGLPAEHRVVVLLRDVHGLSYEEIAAVTRQNVGTVKSRLHRARSALRAALADPPASAEHSRHGDVRTAEAGRARGPGAERGGVR